jgi:16S rRNA (cytosine1402-N4)-methyltransferase
MTYVYHTPVLLAETLRFLNPQSEGIYVDGTVGGGGHAEAILNHLSERGRLIGIDADQDATEFARNRLRRFGNRVALVQGNSRNVKCILENLKVNAIDGMLLDLGVSGRQLDDEVKGFSFRGNERLDMRMDRRQILDAWTVVNRYSEETLADIFWNYGEERLSRRLAKKIVHVRRSRVIETTGVLADLIRSVVGTRFLTKSLARVFQAIRIEVNKELRNLEIALRDGIELLRVGGRIVVISYHSLEDRIVKNFFKEEAAQTHPSGSKLLPDQPKVAQLKILTKKPIVSSREEIRSNSRARSAKLRAAEKVSQM